MRARYDVNGVTEEFLAGRCKDRPDLVKEFVAALNQNCGPTAALLAELGHELIDKEYMNPLQVMKLCLMYGMTLGVLLEKERNERHAYA